MEKIKIKQTSEPRILIGESFCILNNIQMSEYYFTIIHVNKNALLIKFHFFFVFKLNN